MSAIEADVISLWETGAGVRPLERAVLLARFAEPERDVERLPLGTRDAALMRLHARLFGDAVPVNTSCPKCKASVEFSLSIEALLGDEGTVRPSEEIEWEGQSVRVRPPSSVDIAAVRTPKELAARCASPIEPRWLGDPRFARRIAELAATLDPLAEVDIDIACNACGNAWSEPFDICGYLWVEIDQSARSIMDTVVRLAERFGWNERDVLTMSPARRAYYAEAGTA